MADNTLRVTLRLKTIDHLFSDPDLSPFDPYYARYSFAAGMDYLVGEMQLAPRATRTELTVVLPPQQIEPDLEVRTREAIGRYAEAWASSARQEREVEHIRARQVAVAATIFFVVANLVYLQYSRTGEFLGISNMGVDVAMEGLSVAAWVALWWPLDQLINTAWDHRKDERAYRALQGITLRILPDPDPPPA